MWRRERDGLWEGWGIGSYVTWCDVGNKLVNDLALRVRMAKVDLLVCSRFKILRSGKKWALVYGYQMNVLYSQFSYMHIYL